MYTKTLLVLLILLISLSTAHAAHEDAYISALGKFSPQCKALFFASQFNATLEITYEEAKFKIPSFEFFVKKCSSEIASNEFLKQPISSELVMQLLEKFLNNNGPIIVEKPQEEKIVQVVNESGTLTIVSIIAAFSAVFTVVWYTILVHKKFSRELERAEGIAVIILFVVAYFVYGKFGNILAFCGCLLFMHEYFVYYSLRRCPGMKYERGFPLREFLVVCFTLFGFIAAIMKSNFIGVLAVGLLEVYILELQIPVARTEYNKMYYNTMITALMVMGVYSVLRVILELFNMVVYGDSDMIFLLELFKIFETGALLCGGILFFTIAFSFAIVSWASLEITSRWLNTSSRRDVANVISALTSQGFGRFFLINLAFWYIAGSVLPGLALLKGMSSIYAVLALFWWYWISFFKMGPILKSLGFGIIVLLITGFMLAFPQLFFNFTHA